MCPQSLLHAGRYHQDGRSLPAWIKDFYDQCGIWWGADSEIPDEDRARAASIERLCGPGPRRVLELGCGAGHTAAATADLGHQVVAIDLSTRRIQQARALLAVPRPGRLEFIEGDFYTVQLESRFDVVVYWDGFGIGSDADHRRLLRRIAQDWLAPCGSVLLDVASTLWAARQAGSQERLDPLPSVPGSVEMLRKATFDPLNCRWIDEWQPTEHPDNALAQTIRTYTPADFILLLEGTGLALKYLEVDRQPLDFTSDAILTSGPLMEAYSFLVQLVANP
jgi:SAM-dependent methyltransferase